MKLTFAQCEAIKKKNQKEMTQFIQEVYHSGWEDCENEFENADHDRWVDIVNSSPNVKEHFSIWQYDDLYKRLCKEFSQDNVNRILRILTEV